MGDPAGRQTKPAAVVGRTGLAVVDKLNTIMAQQALHQGAEPRTVAAFLPVRRDTARADNDPRHPAHQAGQSRHSASRVLPAMHDTGIGKHDEIAKPDQMGPHPVRQQAHQVIAVGKTKGEPFRGAALTSQIVMGDSPSDQPVEQMRITGDSHVLKRCQPGPVRRRIPPGKAGCGQGHLPLRATGTKCPGNQQDAAAIPVVLLDFSSLRQETVNRSSGHRDLQLLQQVPVRIVG